MQGKRFLRKKIYSFILDFNLFKKELYIISNFKF
jgi:hypothetical protein